MAPGSERPLQIDNPTPFVVDQMPFFDRDGGECMIVLLKATYELSFHAEPRIAEEQSPLVEADVYTGPPDHSGLLLEADYVPPKPATDVSLTAHAVAQRPSDTSVDVTLRIGDRMQQARVYGERRWQGAMGLYRPSSPEPLGHVPLIWENTYGGTDLSSAVERFRGQVEENPAGTGYLARLSGVAKTDTRVPSVVDHSDPLGRPVGFLPMAPGWPLRRRFAGTYDERWQREQAPLLPHDFDDRFLLSSPPGLWGASRFVGGEACLVSGTRVEGDLHFAVPTLAPTASLRFAQHGVRLQLLLDTVHVDTDAMRLHLVYRALARAHGYIDEYEGVEIALEPRSVAA